MTDHVRKETTGGREQTLRDAKSKSCTSKLPRNTSKVVNVHYATGEYVGSTELINDAHSGSSSRVAGASISMPVKETWNSVSTTSIKTGAGVVEEPGVGCRGRGRPVGSDVFRSPGQPQPRDARMTAEVT